MVIIFHLKPVRLWKQRFKKCLGVIEPSVSAYSSLTVLVPKQDESVRLCIDFRKLNKVTKFDANRCRTNAEYGGGNQ